MNFIVSKGFLSYPTYYYYFTFSNGVLIKMATNSAKDADNKWIYIDLISHWLNFYFKNS